MDDIIKLQINCSQSIKNILTEAIHTYANLICPEPSSHYNENLKLDLLSALNLINNNPTNEPILINTSIYQQFYCAINFHYDRVRKELNTSVDQQNQLLLKAIKGDILNDNHLDDAIIKDNIF
ncbi:MAG: hypothetical protein OEY87_07545 [Gammaproteobacteria bacterium]|nr:hypothetical protein [Gammaproteobacteria bacterium]